MKSKVQFILSMIIFGTIGVVVRYIDLASSERALLSSFIGCLFLSVILLLTKRKISWKHVASNLPLLLLSGVALGGNWIFLYQSYDYTSIAYATLGYYFAPVFVLILSPYVLKEKLSMKKILCIVIALIGLLLIVSSGITASESNDIIGLGCGLVAAAFYTALMLLNKQIMNIGKLELTLIQLGITALLLVPYVLVTEDVSLLEVSSSSIPFILILGVINTGLGFLLFFSGMEKLKGQSIAMLSYVDPLVAIVISTLILHENITLIQMIGGALILGSTLISELTAFPIRKKSS